MSCYIVNLINASGANVASGMYPHITLLLMLSASIYSMAGVLGGIASEMHPHSCACAHRSDPSPSVLDGAVTGDGKGVGS